HSAQIEVDTREVSSMVELYLGRAVAPEGFGWTVPVIRGEQPRMKVGVIARGDAERRLGGILAAPSVSERVASPPGVPVRRLLPLAPVRRTYGHRVLAVGDGAGLTKPTTGGGIFYSLFSGLLAAETLTGALRRDRLPGRGHRPHRQPTGALGRSRLGAGALRTYEDRWRAHLGPHLKISSWVRGLFARLADEELEILLEALASEDVQRVIRHPACSIGLGPLIRSFLREPGVKSTLFRAFLR